MKLVRGEVESKGSYSSQNRLDCAYLMMTIRSIHTASISPVAYHVGCICLATITACALLIAPTSTNVLPPLSISIPTL